MARKVKTITITGEEPGNRDEGKSYLLTELSSVKAEKWAARAILALLSSGITIPDKAAKAGLAGVAKVGLAVLAGGGSIPWEQLEPLLDEMMDCVQILVGKNGVPIPRALMTDEDVEEISTRLLLRKEVIGLHFDFSSAADLLSSGVAAETNPSTNTRTSPT